jgi:KGK domain
MRSSVVPKLESAVQELCKTQQFQINTSKYNPQTRNSWQQQWFGENIDCETLKIGVKAGKKVKLKSKSF